MQYPQHIYDPARIAMAEQLIEKELAKLLPSLEHAIQPDLIQAWREKPGQYHLEDGIRDFWDIFAAIIESVKLKPSFTAFMTAENYHWTRETIPVKSVQLSSYLDTLKNIPDLTWNPQVTVGDVMTAINTHDLLAEQKKNSDQHSKESQNNYPIFVRQAEPGENKVMDGNRRLLRAALYNHTTIDAWVARVDGDGMPKNYWVPVNDLMQIVKLSVVASSDIQRQAVRDSLEILFSQSEIARITFNERVLEMRGAEELMALEPSVQDIDAAKIRNLS